MNGSASFPECRVWQICCSSPECPLLMTSDLLVTSDSNPPHPPRMNIGPARLSNHASALREDQINREAKLVASAETAKIMARVSSSSKDFAEEKTNEDDFVWPVLGTKLPHHKRQHVKHWRDTHGEPEPML